MLHTFKVKHNDILIDDKPVSCTGYMISNCVDCIPTATIDLVIIPEIDAVGEVHIGNLSEIAESLSEEDLAELNKIWEVYHERD